MPAGAPELDLPRGVGHTRKQEHSLVRPVVSEPGHPFDIGAGRGPLGVAVVSVGTAHLHQVLDSFGRLVSARPELEVLSVRRRVLDPED